MINKQQSSASIRNYSCFVSKFLHYTTVLFGLEQEPRGGTGGSWKHLLDRSRSIENEVCGSAPVVLYSSSSSLGICLFHSPFRFSPFRYNVTNLNDQMEVTNRTLPS